MTTALTRPRSISIVQLSVSGELYARNAKTENQIDGTRETCF